jgi:hypothetical protein
MQKKLRWVEIDDLKYVRVLQDIPDGDAEVNELCTGCVFKQGELEPYCMSISCGEQKHEQSIHYKYIPIEPQHIPNLSKRKDKVWQS